MLDIGDVQSLVAATKIAGEHGRRGSGTPSNLYWPSKLAATGV